MSRSTNKIAYPSRTHGMRSEGQVSPVAMAQLSVIAFLHGVGKLDTGFQAKGLPPELPGRRL